MPRLGATLAVAAAFSALSAGCGSDGTNQSEWADTANPAAGVRAATARLEEFRPVPRFRAPGPAFDAAGSVRGKRIFEIPITSEVPFISTVERGMRQAASEVGAQLVVYPNQGEPLQWAQGIRTAIAREAAAILLLAQDPRLLGPQIEQAEEAGIPVIVLRTTGQRQPCPVLGTTCVPAPFEDAGRLMADWVIADSGGTADVLVITSNDAPSTDPLVTGLRDELQSRCPVCRPRFVDVPIPDWATKLRTEVQSALVRDPGLDYLIPLYDSMSQHVVPALVASRRDDDVKIATFNGTPFVLQMLQEADVVEMDVGENLAWVGWASMDQAFRAIAGEDPVRSEGTPLRVFDDSNLNEAGRPPRFAAGYGGAYVDGYRKLWGLTE